MKKPSFADILETVQRDVTRVVSHYPLITGLFFKIMNQRELVDHYPWLLNDLYVAVTGDIVMTLGRLFETSEDPRTACLTTFLLGVEPHHAGDAEVKSLLKERRAEFIERIEAWRDQIKAAEKQLALHRNANLAHNDLTKVGRSDITWTEIKDILSLAEGILKAYFHAFHETDQRCVVANVEWELDSFLRWCRLDDYAAHRAREREARRAAFEEWARRRREGDPTAAERPPI